MTLDQWEQLGRPRHMHCKDGCEKPQPFWAYENDDWVLLCGRCWFKFAETVEMEECKEEGCNQLKEL